MQKIIMKTASISKKSNDRMIYIEINIEYNN
jgi:hypothetical protein